MKTITEYLISNHIKNTDYIDLALPSGTLWAKMNVGATKGDKPEDWYGLYFAWGETKGYKATDKHDFSWDTYKFGTKDNLLKYNDKDTLNQLEDEDDAVYQNTNGKYRMPTTKEIRELYKETNNKWVKDYNSVYGLNGVLFTGNNGNTLFIPASGFRYDSNIIGTCNYILLWSSIIDDDPNNAQNLLFAPVYFHMYNNLRYNGLAVRGVLNR